MAKLSFDEVSFYLDEASSCEERQKNELRVRNHYPYLIRYYEGEQWPDETNLDVQNQKRLAIINEYFPNTNAKISELMYQNPEIMAEATRPEAMLGNTVVNVEENQRVMKGALTHVFKKVDALTENKLGLFDMLYAGYGAVEVNIIKEEKVEEASKESLMTRVIKKITNREEAEKKLERERPPEEISYADDKIYLRRWNPIDVLLDWRAERKKDMRYIIKKIYMSKAEFDVKYPAFKDKVKAGHQIPYARHQKDEHKKTILLYEFQLKREKYVSFVISPTYKDQELDWWERDYTTNDFNMKIGMLNEYGKLYPISFAQVNKRMQDDINNYATHMMEVAERNIPKRGYNKNKVKEDGIEALNSPHVNANVPCEGGQESIWAIPHTNVSVENKELLAIFQRGKEKLWGVSEQKLQGGAGKAKFATELQIQEAGFQVQNVDLQDGLRKLIREELNTLKDLIVEFWDAPDFFKITGGEKPEWYVPRTDPMTGMVLNPLSDILTRDYEIDVDISTAFRPNKERQKAEMQAFLTFMTSILPVLNMQGWTLNMEFIKKLARKYDFNPELVMQQMSPEQMAMMMQPKGKSA